MKHEMKKELLIKITNETTKLVVWDVYSHTVMLYKDCVDKDLYIWNTLIIKHW